MRKKWNVEEFNRINLPEVVGKVNPITFANFSKIRFLDCPIYMPSQGWAIPEQAMQFVDMIALAAQFEERYGDFRKDHYVYITIDQKMVEAGKTGRRAGAHSDAYIATEDRQIDITTDNAEIVAKEMGDVSHTYIAYDSTPTEFFNAKFPLIDSTDKGSLKTFDEIARTAEVVTYDPFTVLKMDPYVIHRCAIVQESGPRTFVKISISKSKYARIGNTINPMFKYDWIMNKRSPSERNTPW